MDLVDLLKSDLYGFAASGLRGWFCCLLLVAAAPAQIACGTSTIGATSSPSASVTSPAANMSAANTLYMSCDWDNTGITVTPSDSSGNTWISLGGPTTVSSNLRGQHWYARNATVSASQTFKCTTSSSTADMDVAAMGINGADTAAPLDANPANTTGNTTTPSPGAITTTAANEAIVAFGTSVNSHTWAAGAGYTLAGHNSFHAQQCKIVSATQSGASTAFGSLGSVDNWIAGSATFKQASGAGNAPHGQLPLAGVGEAAAEPRSLRPFSPRSH